VLKSFIGRGRFVGRGHAYIEQSPPYSLYQQSHLCHFSCFLLSPPAHRRRIQIFRQPNGETLLDLAFSSAKLCVQTATVRIHRLKPVEVFRVARENKYICSRGEHLRGVWGQGCVINALIDKYDGLPWKGAVWGWDVCVSCPLC